MPRTIAIGDIHGCADALAALLEAIQVQADDCVVTLGDYVDRGPDSPGVLDQLIALQKQCRLVPLLGNHELMMLSALDSPDSMFHWLQCGGDTTLASYGHDAGNVPLEHLAFIRECRRYYESEHHIFVHANYLPHLPLDQQPDRLLFWEHLQYFDVGFHTIPGRHISGKTAIVGHTPQETGELLDLGDVVCIDTHCVGDGYLTGYDVDSRHVWQFDKRGRPRNG